MTLAVDAEAFQPCGAFPSRLMYEVITEQGGRLSDTRQAVVPRAPGNAAVGGEREGAAKRGSSGPAGFRQHKGGLKRVTFLLLLLLP